MKYALSALLIIVSLVCKSQNVSEIKLSKDFITARTGVWVSGEYTIYVDLIDIESNLKWKHQSFESALQYYDTTSNTDLVNYYSSSIERYQKAIDQIKNAGTEFDLKNLIVYDGTEVVSQNVGSSKIIESVVKQLVEKGAANVYYQSERIYTLNQSYKLEEGDSILNSGYEIRTYFNDSEICMFMEYVVMGW